MVEGVSGEVHGDVAVGFDGSESLDRKREAGSFQSSTPQAIPAQERSIVRAARWAIMARPIPCPRAPGWT